MYFPEVHQLLIHYNWIQETDNFCYSYKALREDLCRPKNIKVEIDLSHNLYPLWVIWTICRGVTPPLPLQQHHMHFLSIGANSMLEKDYGFSSYQTMSPSSGKIQTTQCALEAASIKTGGSAPLSREKRLSLMVEHVLRVSSFSIRSASQQWTSCEDLNLVLTGRVSFPLGYSHVKPTNVELRLSPLHCEGRIWEGRWVSIGLLEREGWWWGNDWTFGKRNYCGLERGRTR